MSAYVMKKIFAIKSEVSNIVRNADGYKFKYPTLTIIKNEIDPLYEKHKLVIVPEIIDVEGNNYTFKVHITDIESGENLDLSYVVKGDTQQQNGVQSSGATMSYMQRYIPKFLFDLDFVDDDPDHKKNSSPKAKQKPTAYNKLVQFVKDNHIEPDTVKSVIAQVGGKGKTAKQLNETQLDKVITELDLLQRAN